MGDDAKYVAFFRERWYMFTEHHRALIRDLWDQNEQVVRDEWTKMQAEKNNGRNV